MSALKQLFITIGPLPPRTDMSIRCLIFSSSFDSWVLLFSIVKAGEGTFVLITLPLLLITPPTLAPAAAVGHFSRMSN